MLQRTLMLPTLIGVAMVGCDGSSNTFRTVGILDAIPPAPIDFLLLCDPTPGSSCTAETLEATAMTVAREAAAIPGSELSLFVLGGDVGSTVKVALFTITAPPRRAEGPFWIIGPSS